MDLVPITTCPVPIAPQNSKSMCWETLVRWLETHMRQSHHDYFLKVFHTSEVISTVICSCPALFGHTWPLHHKTLHSSSSLSSVRFHIVKTRANILLQPHQLWFWQQSTGMVLDMRINTAETADLAWETLTNIFLVKLFVHLSDRWPFSLKIVTPNHNLLHRLHMPLPQHLMALNTRVLCWLQT